MSMVIISSQSVGRLRQISTRSPTRRSSSAAIGLRSAAALCFPLKITRSITKSGNVAKVCPAAPAAARAMPSRMLKSPSQPQPEKNKKPSHSVAPNTMCEARSPPSAA